MSDPGWDGGDSSRVEALEAERDYMHDQRDKLLKLIARRSTTRTPFELTRELHAAMGTVDPPEPTPASGDAARRRLALVAGEFLEFVEVMCGVVEPALRRELDRLPDLLGDRWSRHIDLAELAREVADLHVVLSGTSLEYGLPEDEVIAEVHAANMRKGPSRDGVRYYKPEGFVGPDVEGVMVRCANLARRDHGGERGEPPTYVGRWFESDARRLRRHNRTVLGFLEAHGAHVHGVEA